MCYVLAFSFVAAVDCVTIEELCLRAVGGTLGSTLSFALAVQIDARNEINCDDLGKENVLVISPNGHTVGYLTDESQITTV